MFSFLKAKIPHVKNQDQYKIIERLDTNGNIFYAIDFSLGDFNDPIVAYRHKLTVKHYLQTKQVFVSIEQAEAHIEGVKKQIEFYRHRKIVKVV